MRRGMAMARADYIWVVTTGPEWSPPGKVVSAFTVKHELVHWLKGRAENGPQVSVTRVRDGGHQAGHPPVSIPWQACCDT